MPHGTLATADPGENCRIGTSKKAFITQQKSLHQSIPKQFFHLPTAGTQTTLQKIHSLQLDSRKGRFQELAVEGDTRKGAVRGIHQAPPFAQKGAWRFAKRRSKQFAPCRKIHQQINDGKVIFPFFTAKPGAGGASLDRGGLFGKRKNFEFNLPNGFTDSCHPGLHRSGKGLIFGHDDMYGIFPHLLVCQKISLQRQILIKQFWPKQSISRVLFPSQVTL